MTYACGGCFGHWILNIEIYLKFGACDLLFNCLTASTVSTGSTFILI
ncbi:hypothetical protein D1BOALGB6SA_3359 [Olavius sp. associated proteobacterium Delta 1]|nr:hypothetical protein D1BOALGB6SA_3359 [Olavius sp. associated proteobacterium Delta 1]